MNITLLVRNRWRAYNCHKRIEAIVPILQQASEEQKAVATAPGRNNETKDYLLFTKHARVCAPCTYADDLELANHINDSKDCFRCWQLNDVHERVNLTAGST
jgi:hypothetical protein